MAPPAADDDGSGTVAVLEAARLFAPFAFENTVIFALWDEENRAAGSDHFAGVAAAADDTILPCNVDAIAYDGDGDDLMRVLHSPSRTASH